ncbi:3-dehydroquinate synthase [Marininema halotolerans]|uniref:3-dehydroquinate synthase n=1 Tax=Marininema halotolerans TaxID=1155944 RepID=A0A1I6TZ83_9BACL|nr:3-dehydroquinate synthase [Marininema halotolerans]SFS94502.1 3-dehydroquinate synthase [Marininema halotolerans]
MRTIYVQLPQGGYPIHIGSGLYSQLPNFIHDLGWDEHRPLMVIADSHVAPLYGEKVVQPLDEAGYQVSLVTFPAGEHSKSSSTLEKLTEECIRAGLDRNGAILALGGGVTGDLAGFLAASYMRGIPFIQLPTTLLAHDSSVGGKVGINHSLGKNMLGAFHQPSLVVFDTDTLITLPRREVVSGFAEVVKHALIYDDSFAKWLLDHHVQLNDLHSEYIAEAIARGCQVKADVVALDEREHGLRAILNYGHTMGHALEAISDYTYAHGEAVSIGMVGASLLGEKLRTARNVHHYTKEILAAFSLPTSFSGPWSNKQLVELMRRDKKALGGSLTFVLPKGIGEVVIQHDVQEEVVSEVLQELRGGVE